MLNGKKLSLRPFDEHDIENTVKWLNNIEFGVLIDRVHPTTVQERKDWFSAISKDKTALTFAIVLNESNNHIGNLGLINIDYRSRRGQLWIYLENQNTGKGLGIEALDLILEYAFQYLNLNRVFLYVVSTNVRALSFYKKCGFKVEGTFRQHIYLKNKYIDAIWLGILKEEYYCEKKGNL
jgi:RimJ/RimL family protein N-acetyltransferase